MDDNIIGISSSFFSFIIWRIALMTQAWLRMKFNQFFFSSELAHLIQQTPFYFVEIPAIFFFCHTKIHNIYFTSVLFIKIFVWNTDKGEKKRSELKRVSLNIKPAENLHFLLSIPFLKKKNITNWRTNHTNLLKSRFLWFFFSLSFTGTY